MRRILCAMPWLLAAAGHAAGEPAFTPLDLKPHFNNDGIAPAGQGADLDGSGNGFAAEAMPPAGSPSTPLGASPSTPLGASWTRFGIPFRFPPAEGADNVACDGQRIELASSRGLEPPPTWLFALVCGAPGAYPAYAWKPLPALVVHYENSPAAGLAFGAWDWELANVVGDVESIDLAYPHRVVAWRARTWVAKGQRAPKDVGLFLAAFRLDPSRRVTALTLPKQKGIHVFALTFASGDVPYARLLASQIPIAPWRFKEDDAEDLAGPDVDDAGWRLVSPVHEWKSAGKTAWFRARVAAPAAWEGQPVVLHLGIDGDGEVFVDGKRVAEFGEGDADVALTDRAQPGQSWLVAFRARSRPAVVWEQEAAHFRYACLLCPTIERLPLALVAARAGCDLFGGDAAYLDSDALWEDLLKLYRAEGAKGVEAFLANLAERYRGLRETLQAFDLTLFAHSHMDMEWRWTLDETAIALKNTFTGVCDYMDALPFTFAQSQAAAYQLMEERHPDVFKRIVAAVKKGKWFPVGGMWVECDLNLPHGEALARQLLYGKRYFQQKFGFDVTIGWNPDSFGHSGNLPQLLRKAGIDAYVLERCAPNWGPFWWEGIDGTKMFCWRPPAHYNRTYLNLRKMLAEAKDDAAKHGAKIYASCYGVGDHGGYPPMADTRRTVELAQLPVYANVHFGSPVDFLRAYRERAKDVPTLQGELNAAFEGCYTSHTNTKYNNRRCEALIMDAEAACAIASLEGSEYPRATFLQAWRAVLLNQFHDILPGSSCPATYGYVLGWPQHSADAKSRYEDAAAAANEAYQTALASLASRVESAGDTYAVLVFNPLAWPRSGEVALDASQYPGTPPSVAVDPQGRALPIQNGRFVAVDLPPMGYRVYRVEARGERETARAAVTVDRKKLTMESSAFRVRLDERGNLAEVFDKINNRPALAAPGNAFEFRHDKGNAWEIWYSGEHKFGETDTAAPYETIACDEPAKVALKEAGPVRATFEAVQPFKGSKLVRRVSLVEGLPVVLMEFECEWKDDCADVLIKALFPVDVTDPVAWREIPYGAIARPIDGREVAAQTWVDLTAKNGSYGVSLLNAGRYGHSFKDNVIGLTLLRDYPSAGPDLQPEDASEGKHVLRYALYPHAGDWRAAEAYKRGWELNHPPAASPVYRRERGLPAERSYARCDGAAIASAFKKSEDGDGYVLRLFQPTGVAGKAVVDVGFNVQGAALADLLEKSTGKEPPLQRQDHDRGAAFEVELGAFGIETVVVEPRSK